MVTNLRSSKTRDNFYISGEDDLETRIFRISNSRGLLVSSELREMHDISTNCGNFQASLCLVSFPDSNDWSNIMVPIDSRCRRIGSLEKKEADFYCTHCKMKPLNVEHVIYVLVELVDQVGSTAIAEVFDKNAECLFGISILEFCNMDGDSKCRVFMDVIGRQFDMSVTRIENEKAVCLFNSRVYE